MVKTDVYEALLLDSKLRNTKHRVDILAVIDEHKLPLSIEDIFLQLKNKGQAINLSTVYRAVETMASKGLITKISMSVDGKGLYIMSSLNHSHYLICNNCHRIFVINGCPLEEYEKQLEEKTGFAIENHKLEFYGQCKECRKN